MVPCSILLKWSGIGIKPQAIRAPALVWVRGGRRPGGCYNSDTTRRLLLELKCNEVVCLRSEISCSPESESAFLGSWIGFSLGFSRGFV